MSYHASSFCKRESRTSVQYHTPDRCRFFAHHFFLVASHFIRHEQLENVELPTATQGRDQQDATSRVVVTVATDRRLRLGAHEASIDEIEKQLLLMAEEHGANSTELRIRIDRNLPYSVVEPLLLSAARSGIKKVRFAVLPRL